MTGIILAGGKNTRIKTDKIFLMIGKRTIIEIVITKLRKIFNNILIVVNTAEQSNLITDYFSKNKLDYLLSNVKIITDIIPSKGSLGGLYSGLVNSKTEYNFVVGCDMPFINTKLIEYMKTNYNNFDVIVPKHKKGYEPLHSVYSKNCIKHIALQLKQNNLKITDFFPKVRIKEIKEDIIKHFDRQSFSFFNINTNIDYQQALKLKNNLLRK